MKPVLSGHCCAILVQPLLSGEHDSVPYNYEKQFIHRKQGVFETLVEIIKTS